MVGGNAVFLGDGIHSFAVGDGVVGDATTRKVGCVGNDVFFEFFRGALAGIAENGDGDVVGGNNFARGEFHGVGKRSDGIEFGKLASRDATKVVVGEGFHAEGVGRGTGFVHGADKN